ncbi:30S ribosomal protein S6 [Candidatus Peregrinibacteria bacterium]|nr:30S ribosomal protein S6 [Candidatus Peregrinibacteria bacterium]
MPLSVTKASAEDQEDVLPENGRLYECTVLYPLSLSQKEEQDLRKNIEMFFTEVGGQQVAFDVWGRRGLAYAIGGAHEGNFVVYHYHLDPAHVREVDRQIRILPGVLRHLLIKLPEGYSIVRYSQLFEIWQEEQKTSVVRERITKEEHLKKRVIERASKRTVSEKPDRSKGGLTAQALTKGIEKIISDEDIHL